MEGIIQNLRLFVFLGGLGDLRPLRRERE
jgi:hypothetical protein